MSHRAGAMIAAACIVLVAAGLAISLVVSSGSGADGDGERWGAPTRIPVPASAAASARASFDPSGRAHVAWVERRAGRWSLRAIDRPPGGEWSEPQTIVNDRPFSIFVGEIAGNARGDAAILWTYSGRRRSVLSASVRPSGEGWQPEQALSRVGRQRSGRIAIDERGAVTVAGRGLAGPGLWAVRYEPHDGWRAPVRVSPPGLGTDSPALAMGRDGRATIVAQLKQPGSPRRLFSVRAGADGVWSSPQPLPDSALAGPPTVLATSTGDVFAAWTGESGRGPSYSIRVARRAATGGWSAPVTLDGRRSQQPGPVVLSGAGGGGAVVAWPRWERRPEDREATIRAAVAHQDGALGDPARVAAVALPSPAAPPGSVVIYGPVPIVLTANATGPPLLAWAEPVVGRSGRPSLITADELRPDGSWGEPVTISESPRPGFPLAADSAPERAAIIWIEGPPDGAATELLLAER